MRPPQLQAYRSFVVTVVSIVLTDLLTGILIGLATDIVFILHSNMRHPMRRIVEKHLRSSIDPTACRDLREEEQGRFDALIDTVTRQNVQRAVESFRWHSRSLDKLAHDRRIAIVGALYHVESGAIEILTERPAEPTTPPS